MHNDLLNQQKGTILREILIDAIKKDSIGPREKEEEFVNFERPQSRYFSGVLYPKRTPTDESDDIVDYLSIKKIRNFYSPK